MGVLQKSVLKIFPKLIGKQMFSDVKVLRSVKVFIRILTGKKHRQIKLQRLQKVRIWAFGPLVHQINSL